jgi:CubicO group peptidase (beta-lactamase class C family)
MPALTIAEAGDEGLSREGLAVLKAGMTQMVQDGRRAGLAYLVARRGRIVAFEAIGQSDLEAGLPMTRDAQFRIYSMTRIVGGAAALALIEQGRLGLDDPVARYIPEVADTPVIKRIEGGQVVETEPQATPMTVRHLLTYTSGLGYAFNYPAGLNFRQDDVVCLDGDLASGMRALARYPLLHQPGARWFYGFSGDMLGRVMEVAAGDPLDRLIQRTVLDPAGMADTGFWTPHPQRLAKVYGASEAEPALKPVAAFPLSHWDRPSAFVSAGGGLVSTVMDCARLGQMLLDGGQGEHGRVLQPHSVKAMLTRQTTPEQGEVYWYLPKPPIGTVGYAWGLSIGVRAEGAHHAVPGSPGDAGWMGLASTTVFVDPQEELVAVAMSQYIGPTDQDLVMTLRRGVYGALQG